MIASPVRESGRVLVVATLCLASGCAGNAHRMEDAPSAPGAIERRCGPPPNFRPIPASPSRDDPRPDAETPASGGLSPQALEIADAIGADELASRMQRLNREAASEGARFRLLQVRQQLSERILLALLEVKSAAAEADCEEERADEIADRLQEMQEERVKRLTIFSLLGSGLGGIVSGGLAWAAQGTAAAVAGIVAGATEATFGSMALFEDIEHDFRHDRNLLKEVWEGPKNPSLMPVSVWRFLNRPLREEPARRSLRETLIARWREDGRLGEAGSETQRHRIALLFGNGGIYTIKELRDRAVMFDMLESDINLMSHDLEEFLREISAPGNF